MEVGFDAGKFEQVTRLALQCLTDGFERGEADGACLAGFQNGRVARVIPILSDSSVRVMRRSWNMSSSLDDRH